MLAQFPGFLPRKSQKEQKRIYLNLHLALNRKQDRGLNLDMDLNLDQSGTEFLVSNLKFDIFKS